MVADVAQQEHTNKKSYALTYINIYIYIYIERERERDWTKLTTKKTPIH